MNMKEAKVRRKTFVAREDLINRLSFIARDRGYSLYALVNEIFELAIRAEEAGVNLKGVVEGYETFKAAREGGFILGLERLWYDMADLAFERAKDETLKGWYEAGLWFAKRYLSRGGGAADPFTSFKKDLEAFTWNVSDFNMERDKGTVYVRLLSPRFPESYTFLFKEFIKGGLNAFGYRVIHEEVGRGIIRLEAAKEGSL
jgi:hypothetical protein